jgi:hypothetical protein
VLELVIGEDGSVVDSRVTAGEAPFAEVARSAAGALRFSPALRGGIPVRARIALRVAFHQPEPAAPSLAPTAPGGAAPSPPENPEAVPEPGAPSAPPAPEGPTVVVLGEQAAEAGSIHIPKEEARRVPGAFGDPFRVVEVLPGVAPVLSGLPYFYVRGSPPGSVGYLIDGIDVPLLFHVGPGPSVISPLLIDRVDLFPGPYPARFGRSAGALLAGETSLPSDHSRVEGQARVFDASAALEHPFDGGRGSLALGGRYSYMQALLALVAPDYQLGYGDYQAKLSYAVTRADRLTLFSFGAFDHLRNKAIGLTLFDVAFHRIDARWDHSYESGRVRVGLTGRSDRVLTSTEDPGVPGSFQRTQGLRLRSEWEQRLSANVRMRSGADFALDRVTGDREQIDDRKVVVYPDRVDRTGGAYADFVLRPRRGFEIVPGLRVDALRSRGVDHVFVDPRLSVRTRLGEGVAYLAGFGRAHQVPATAVRMPGRRPNAIERSTQAATQASQGIEYALPLGMLGRTTLFHQFLDIDTPGVFGRSYGVEQFLRRNFTESLGGFLSYTLSRAEGQVGADRVLSSFDRTHVLSAVLGYDFGRGFRLGTRAYWASGRPYEIACPTTDCRPGGPVAPTATIKRGRLPSFFRLDLRFEKRFTFSNGWWLTATAEWFNATLSKEADNIDLTPRGLVIERRSALTLPSLGLEFGEN